MNARGRADRMIVRFADDRDCPEGDQNENEVMDIV